MLSRTLVLLPLVLSHLAWPCQSFDPPAIFPTSTRQALVEKSKQINPSNYASTTWSNRAATILTPTHLEPSVYTSDRPFYWNQIDVSCRMTVIELPNGKEKPFLFIHSPVQLDGPLKRAIDDLGIVKYVMSSNYEHLSFVSEWYLSYPDAHFWGCPGLASRREDIRWTGEIPPKCRPPGWNDGSGTTIDSSNIWDTNIIQPLHIDCEKNPFTGKSFFNEVVFYHKPSKTFIATDLFYNYPKNEIPNSQFGRDDSWELAPKVNSVPVGSKLWGFGMHKIYHPFYNTFMITNKDTFKEIAHHIVNDWDVETIIPRARGPDSRKRSVSSSVTRLFQNQIKQQAKIS